MPASQEVISELAPRGTLRAGINLSNFLLVTIGVEIKLAPFALPGERGGAQIGALYEE